MLVHCNWHPSDAEATTCCCWCFLFRSECCVQVYLNKFASLQATWWSGVCPKILIWKAWNSNPWQAGLTKSSQISCEYV